MPVQLLGPHNRQNSFGPLTTHAAAKREQAELALGLLHVTVGRDTLKHGLRTHFTLAQ